MKDFSKNGLRWVICTLAMTFVLLYPNITFAISNNTGFSYVVTSLVFLTPVALILALIPKRWLYCILFGLVTVVSMAEQMMVDLYGEYILPGAILSALKTNSQEASEFYNTNIREIARLFPILVLGILSCVCYRRPHLCKYKWFVVVVLLLMPVTFIAYKLVGFYKSEITLKYYADTHIWNRPPYNFLYQGWNTHIYLKHLSMLENRKNIDMGAHRAEASPSQKEVYVFAIGESLI